MDVIMVSFLLGGKLKYESWMGKGKVRENGEI